MQRSSVPIDGATGVVTVNRAFCPEKHCRQPLLFHSTASYVRCPSCNRDPVAISGLRDIEYSSGAEEGTDFVYWKASLGERNGSLSIGRARLVNRAIDGVSGVHYCSVMCPYFENFGITDNDEVKKLADMGRTEPINVATFGDYAFAIRKEHMDVAGYGRHRDAAKYFSRAIDAIGRANGMLSNEGEILVPLEGPPNAPCAVSRACFGREVFARRIRVAIVENLKEFASEYKKMTNHAELLSKIEANEQIDPAVVPDDLVLAALANMLFRPVILLEANPPFIEHVLLPILRKPEKCRSWKGPKRSPLLLAHSKEHGVQAMVSLAVANGVTSRIKPIYLPHEWLKRVWGATDQSIAEGLLAQYLDFDENDRCLVANGKYFKPEFIRRIVTAFEKTALDKEGVHPRLVADFLADYPPPTTMSVHLAVMGASVSDQLNRCVNCDMLVLTEVTEQDVCPHCIASGDLRTQRLDGTVVYREGDHTETAAPNSWCFTKRKHFYNGVEYDNPPLRVEVCFYAYIEKTWGSVRWFSGESDKRLNSTLQTATAELARRYKISKDDERCLVKDVGKQISEKVSDRKLLLENRISHLRDSLNDFGIKMLFNDLVSAPITEPNETSDVDGVCQIYNETSRNYLSTISEIRNAMARVGETAYLKRKMESADSAQTNIDDVAFHALSNAIGYLGQERRWRALCSRSDLFKWGGLYYEYAKRLDFKKSHFSLPLLGDLNFSFSGNDDSLVVCLPGGHFAVHESVNLICDVFSDDPDIFTKFTCDHSPTNEQ